MSHRAPRRGPLSVLAALVGAVVVTTLLSPPVAASTTVAESYRVPTSGVLRLSGHGFGHGHGMSQYGARGAARQGLSAARILGFYYPGTTSGEAAGRIRVLISADTDGDVSVLPRAGLRVRDVSSRLTYGLPTTAGIKTWRLRTVDGVTVLDYDDGEWHVYQGRGTSEITDDAEFYSPDGVVLRVAGGTRAYRGTLRLSGSRTVNRVRLEDYVKGVVPREMPASWEPAAVQAQAVAARTYAAFDRAANRNRYYQTCDTTSCQVYGGLDSEDPRSNAAVEATARQVRIFDGEPAFTQFASSSGGWLAAGRQPYLVAKADPYDDFSANPVHSWTNTLTRATIQRSYPRLGTLRRVKVTRRDGNGHWSGRVEEMVLVGSRASITLGGSEFRSRFGLRSTWFHFGA